MAPLSKIILFITKSNPLSDLCAGQQEHNYVGYNPRDKYPIVARSLTFVSPLLHRNLSYDRSMRSRDRNLVGKWIDYLAVAFFLVVLFSPSYQNDFSLYLRYRGITLL